MDPELQKLLQQLGQLAASAQSSQASIQAVGQGMARLRVELQRGSSSTADYARQIRRVANDFEDLDDSLKKSSAGQAMFAEQSKMAGQILRQSLGDFAGDIAKIGIAQTIDYFKTQFFTAAKSLQENVGGTQAAFNLQNAAIDNQIKTLDMLSQSAEKATGVLAMIPGYARGLALLTGVASTALAVDKGFKTLQKEGMQYLQAEITKTQLGLDTMTAAGALFTRGSEGMRKAMTDSRLEVSEFTKIVTNNTNLLSDLGGSVNGGIRRFREVSKEMVPFRKELTNLGYSYQDQAQAQLEYMDMLNRSGKLSMTTAEDVAKGTKEYLINQRAISAFTGEDAKRAQARAKEASTQLAVQSKLMDMGKGAMERFQSGISNMEPFMQKALQEAVAFDGTVVDKGLNQLFAMSPARQKLFEQTYQDTLDQSLSAEDITRRYQERVKELGPALASESKELGSTIGAANLAIGALPELTKQLESTLQLGIKGQNAATTGIENTVTAAHKLAETTDSLRDTLSRGQIVFKEYQAAVNDILTPSIAKFAKQGVPDLPDMFKNKGIIKQLEDSFAFTIAGLKSVGAVGENIGKLLPNLQASTAEFMKPGTVLEQVAGKFNEYVGKFGESVRRFSDSISGGGTRERPAQRPNRETRDLGTLGMTGNLFESKDFFGKVAKGETVMTPKQLENLVQGVSGSSFISGMQSLQKSGSNQNQLDSLIKGLGANDQMSGMQSLVQKSLDMFKNAEKNLSETSFNGVEQLAFDFKKSLEKISLPNQSETKDTQNIDALQSAVNTIINNPNLLTNSLTELKQQLSSENQTQISILEKYIQQMETLISAMEDNVDYSKRIADNIA